MIARAIRWSASHALLVIGIAALAIVAGIVARRKLPQDVIPDLADPQMGLVVEWMGHPASEVAAAVTDVLTRAFDGVPGGTVRGSSMAGMAYVTVVFESSAQLARGRAAVLDRLERARGELPPNVRVQIGPDVSSAGWAYQYALVDRSNTEDALSPLTLRRLQDTVVRPGLRTIPGVAEVASVGGATPAIVVECRADRLRAQGLAFADVASALREHLQSHAVTTAAALGDVRIANPPGRSEAPLRIADVGRVRVAEDMPTGIADLDGTREAVGGVVLVQRGADVVAVVDAVKRELGHLRPSLPARAEIVTAYDRTELAAGVDATMVRALLEEVAVVTVVLLVFLLHARSALIPLFTLATTLALTFLAMLAFRLPTTIVSFGGIGIALGLAVDADVVALEACHRRIAEAQASSARRSLRDDLVAAAVTFTPAILTSLVITMVAFLPVFGFAGETGRLLRPLALTKTLVIASTAVVAVTLAPALRDRMLRGRVVPEFDNRLTRELVRLYSPLVRFALSRPALTLATAGLALVSCIPLLPRLGGEFLPHVDEGDLLFMPTTLPGVSAEQAASQMRRQELAIKTFPEVDRVFGKVGRADTAMDPAPISMIEMTIRLAARSRWPRVAEPRLSSGWSPPLRALFAAIVPETRPETTAELVDKLDGATRFPGWTNAWTAPVRARMDMMSTGIRTPVGIRITASDPARLSALGAELRAVAARVPGTRGALFESLGGEAWLHYAAEPGAERELGVDGSSVDSTARLLVDGGQIGEVEVGGQRMRVRLAPDYGIRGEADQLREATVRSNAEGNEQPVPLGLLGHTTYAVEPSVIRSEGGKLVGYVDVDVTDDTDPATFVEHARAELDRATSAGEIVLRKDERVDWTGQYKLFVAARGRLLWIVPVMVIAMTGLLYWMFRSAVEAAIVFASVPFALVGSVWTLYLLHYALSPAVWIGVFSAVGLAMQTGVVMVVYIDESFHRRVREGRLVSRDDVIEAHMEGTIKRLRPKLMTVTTMAAGLLPLLWAQGSGSEILRRVAAPMLGGLATSAFLTLEILPVLYTIWRTRQLETAQRAGVSIRAVIGSVPPWARG
jgi:Cu(I)/Ag(I) efflux system membrane protein CusA/SilA